MIADHEANVVYVADTLERKFPSVQAGLKAILENIAELGKPNEHGQRSDGRYTARAAAALLNRHPRTIAIWCQSGRLDGVHASREVGWWVRVTAKEIDELRRLDTDECPDGLAATARESRTASR